MAMLNAREVNVLMANIEGGAGESLYNRLTRNTPKKVRLSLEEKDVMWWHLTQHEDLGEYSHYDEEDIAVFKKCLGISP